MKFDRLTFILCCHLVIVAPQDVLAQGRDDILAQSPHNASEVYFRLFTDTVTYAYLHESNWAQNVHVAALWRAGLAELSSECFLREGRSCQSRDKTDRQLALETLEEAMPASLPGWRADEGIVRETVVSGIVDLMAHLLARRIDETYSAIEQMEIAEAGSQPAPELVYSMAGAMGRYQREEVLRMRPLSGTSDHVGFLVMSISPLADAEELFVRGKIEGELGAAVPDSVSEVTMNEILAHLADAQNRERLKRALVPEGKTGGVSLFLLSEGQRAQDLANQGELEEAIAILQEIRPQSDNPEFNQRTDDFLELLISALEQSR